MERFLFYQSRIPDIVIDSNVNEILEKILIAHELGHAVLHKGIAMMVGFQEMEVFDLHRERRKPVLGRTASGR